MSQTGQEPCARCKQATCENCEKNGVEDYIADETPSEEKLMLDAFLNYHQDDDNDEEDEEEEEIRFESLTADALNRMADGDEDGDFDVEAFLSHREEIIMA